MNEIVIIICRNGHNHSEQEWPDSSQPCPTCGASWKKSIWKPVSIDRKQAPATHYRVIDKFDVQLGKYVYDSVEEKRIMKEKGLCDATGAWGRPKPDYPAKGTVFSFPAKYKG